MYIYNICGREFDYKNGLNNHLTRVHKAKGDQKVHLNKQVDLDITYNYLENYKKSHNKCEICGKTVSETTKWINKYAVKNLCIDHNHKTGKFRGLLCQSCNRQLGWYEKNKSSIDMYLNNK